MVYAEDDLDRMNTDATLRRQYFWHVGQSAVVRAGRLRRKGCWNEADAAYSFGRAILDHIDRLVEVSSDPALQPDE